jgi:chromosomal replication initiation ATPase DnaA
LKGFIPCRNCATKKGPKPGMYYEVVQGQQVVVECDCYRAFKHKKRFEIQAAKSGIWPDALQYSPERDYVGEKSLKSLERFQKYVTNFEQFPGQAVYIWGPNGTQKTTLAQWAGATLMNQGFNVNFVLMQTLLVALTSGFEDEEKRALINSQLYKPDLLIIDEAFSKDKVTLYKSGYQLPFLDRFLRERLDGDRKGILFISNVPPNKIEDNQFSKSIHDLIERKTYRTTLEFSDNFLRSKNDFDVTSLFDE